MQIKVRYTVEFEELIENNTVDREEIEKQAEIDKKDNFNLAKQDIIKDLRGWNDYEKVEVTAFDYEIVSDNTQ